MKKIFYTLLLLFVVNQIGFAQCTPGTYTGNHGFILPDSSQFPHAALNQAFSTNIQIQVAHDTTGTFTVSGIPVAGTFVFDSITVHSVTTTPALPNGVTIQYTCNPAGCKFLGASTGCINVSVPANGLTTDATYRIHVTAVGKGVFTPQALPIPSPQSITQTIDWYKLVVGTGGATIVNDLSESFNFNEFSIVDVKPIPTADVVNTSFYAPKNSEVKMNVLDIIGKSVQSQNINASKGFNKLEIDLSKIPNGIYLLNFSTEGRNFSKKLIVQH